MGVDLVTGGAGFIGHHLVARLLADRRTVRVVDDLSTGRPERLAPFGERLEFLRLDLAADDLGRVVSDVERIFHLAAVPSVPRSVRDPLTAHASVATGTLRLLVAAREAGVRRLVLSSSSSVYGETVERIKREDMPLRPLSPYAVAKAAAEGYARAFAQLHGMDTVALRYFNVFGPGQDPSSPYAAVIPLFISRMLRDEKVVVYGDGEQTRDFTYVEDVVEANLRAVATEAPGGLAYNIAAGHAHSVNELVAVLGRIIGRPPHVEHGPRRPGDIMHSRADVLAARRDMGWQAEVAFEEGLRRTVAWHRAGTD